MAAIHDLIAQVADARLRDRITAEWTKAMRDRKFGLAFEDHVPELLPLPKARPRKGDLVCQRGGSLKDLWRVQGFSGGRVQSRRPQPPAEGQPAEAGEFDMADLMVVRDFGEPALPGSAVAEPEGTQDVEASDLDIERHFQDAGRVLTNGLHKAYWEAHAERDSAEVKVELVALCRDAGSMTRIETAAEQTFNAMHDQHKKAISRMPEARRRLYDRLRLATAKPADVPQDLHLYVDTTGAFARTLVGWEPDVLAEELIRGDVLGWLRNLPHKPWSLEIPCEVGAEVRPMFPDFVLVRRLGSGLVVDILEPHDPSRDDNVDKARALARFAERHGGQFGRIQLIRKRRTAGGGAQIVRLEINRRDAWQQVLLVTTATQLDRLFHGDH